MKNIVALVLLACTSLAVARQGLVLNDERPYDPFALEHPDFSLNLSEMRLVQLEGQDPAWVSELDKVELKAQGINFMDITETRDLGARAHLRPSWNKDTFPSPNASEVVKPVLRTLGVEGMLENLQKFTSFTTRHYRSTSGQESQKWLLGKIYDITATSASEKLREYITVAEFPHSWGQNSIVARINGTSDSDDAVVIIGAHQDSTNLWPFLPAPGADDDGSGSVTILEAYRALLAADFQPVRPVEFHWYSAEEGGLLGSQAIAKDYEARGVNVLAMSQFDMTAWVKKGTHEEVGIITDFVDEGVTVFNKKLVDAYLDIPYTETKCGYACSDHASWSKAGYPSSFTIESAFENSNKHIHSSNDRLDVSDEFSFEHMLEFSKLATSFAIELGGWTGK